VFIAPGPEKEGNPGEKEKTDIRMKGESVDAPTNRLQLNGEFDGGNYGVKFRLHLDFDTIVTDFTRMRDRDDQKTFNYGFDPAKQSALAWGDLFRDTLRLSVGKFAEGDNVWNTTLDEKWGLEQYQTGVRAQLRFDFGLDAGILFKIPPQYVAPEEKYTVQRLLREMIIGARYDNSKFSVALAFEMDGMDNYRDDEQAATIGFMWRGVPKMQTGLEAKMQYLGLSKDLPFNWDTFAFNILQMAGYDFSSYFYGRLKIYEEKKTNEENWHLKIYPFAIYKFSRWLEVGGELGFRAEIGNFADTWSFAVKPVMYYHLGANATIGAYWYNQFFHCYNYQHSTDLFDPYYTEVGLVFYWSF
jgi:hypothetical protein